MAEWSKAPEKLEWLLGPTKWARVRIPLLTLFYKTVLFLTTYKHRLKIVILVYLFIF